jgi:hypothetical protein
MGTPVPDFGDGRMSDRTSVALIVLSGILGIILGCTVLPGLCRRNHQHHECPQKPNNDTTAIRENLRWHWDNTTKHNIDSCETCVPLYKKFVEISTR